MDSESSSMLWRAYKILTASWHDPDLATLETVFGCETLTAAECIERMMRAVARSAERAPK